MAQCPAHDDRHASLSVGQGDDGRILIYCHAGCGTDSVLTAVGATVWDLFPAPRNKGKVGNIPIEAEYTYTDEMGRLLFQVVRLRPKGFRQRRPDPNLRGCWLWSLGDIRRVLYRLPEVLEAVKRGDLVFLVEGEKDVENLRQLGLVATTNPGGAGKWRQEYSEALRNGRVVILPDNDGPGREHARRVQAELPQSVILELAGLPRKGDVSDWLKSGGTRDELLRLATEALAHPSEVEEQSSEHSAHPPFRALGYRGGAYYFLASKTGQVVALTPSGFRVKQNFFQLAPMDWWEDRYSCEGKSADYVSVADDLMQQCHAVGLFAPEKIRGRGAWLDNGRVVLHRGSELIVSGQAVPPEGFDTQFVYPADAPLDFNWSRPLSPEESHEFCVLSAQLLWEQRVNEALFAGWCAVAPICGALAWRSHIWITGASNSGKTFIKNNIVVPLLGDFPCDVQGSTTEAGIRQALKCDARPVLFDEAESDTVRDQAAMQRVLELARQASSDGNAVIAKGTASGDAMLFRIRAAFCFLSIGVSVSRRADETRVTVLSLRAPTPQSATERMETQEAFEQLCDFRDRLLTDQYCARFVARSVVMVPVIRKSAETLKRVIAVELGSQRLGDQLGTLLAGYFSLLQDEPVTVEQAEQAIKDYPELWTFLPEARETDEWRCLHRILEARIRVNLGDRTEERTVGELVDAVASVQPSGRSATSIDTKVAQEHLARYGIRGNSEGLLVSTCHSGLDDLLAGTPWSDRKWSQHLKRLPGACSPRTNTRFAGGHSSKTTMIPWSTLYEAGKARLNECAGVPCGGGQCEENYLPF